MCTSCAIRVPSGSVVAALPTNMPGTILETSDFTTETTMRPSFIVMRRLPPTAATVSTLPSMLTIVPRILVVLS